MFQKYVQGVPSTRWPWVNRAWMASSVFYYVQYRMGHLQHAALSMLKMLEPDPVHLGQCLWAVSFPEYKLEKRAHAPACVHPFSRVKGWWKGWAKGASLERLRSRTGSVSLPA